MYFNGVSYFALLKLVPYDWAPELTTANKILFLWTYWLEFLDFIPVLSIMIHYSIVAFLPSDEEVIQNDVAFWIYYGGSIVWIYIATLVQYSVKQKANNERVINDQCLNYQCPIRMVWWKAFLCVLQFFNFSYIRAKPFKFLIGAFTPITGFLVFWGLHFFCLINAYFIRRYSSDMLL